jgi:hypothetical protein
MDHATTWTEGCGWHVCAKWTSSFNDSGSDGVGSNRGIRAGLVYVDGGVLRAFSVVGLREGQRVISGYLGRRA